MSIWQDVRYGARVLAKSPGFTAVAVVTLALGIGANTAIFSIVYGVLLRPLPYPEPQRIVQLAEAYKGEVGEEDVTATQLERLRDFSGTFEHIAGYTAVGFNLATGTEAEHVRGLDVSADYFRVLGIRPALGRNFVSEEDTGSGQRVAIISNALWRRRFASDANELGKNILLNGEPYRVIGVMPGDFDAESPGTDGTRYPVDVWAPLALVAKTVGGGENIGVIARLKRGVTPAQLASQAGLITQAFRREFAGDTPPELSIEFLPYQFLIGADVRAYLFVLFGAIGFVMLIACVNVANLLLARGAARSREIAVRMALGASRARLMRQLLTESVLIALAGGAVGLALAQAGLRSLLAIAPFGLPRLGEVHLDATVFAFALAVSVATGILFGLAPAVSASRTNLNDSLKEGSGKASAGKGRARLRQTLVIGEFALSLVLLCGAGLMIATFAKLLRTDPGFNPHPVLSMQFWLTGSKYNSTPEVANFYRAAIQRVEALPGVDAAAVVAAGLPLERGGNNGIRVAGPKESEWINVDYREITPGYFRTLEIRLRQGRLFADADTENSSRVAIVNETLARKYLGGEQAIGQHIYVSNILCEVVGVVGDTKSYLDKPAEPATYIPASQASFETSKLFEGWFPRTMVVRSGGDPLALTEALRRAFATVDANVPTGQIRSMDQVLSRSLALRSFMMELLSVFGGLALLLASVGIYGVSAHTVAQRTREIGVRMAMGASPREVLLMILREALRLVAVGVAFGIAAALALTKLVAAMLYNVNPADPLIFASVTALLVCVSLAACYVPARRAMRVDPMVALRYE